MIKHLVITDKGANGIPEHPDRLVMSATDFIGDTAPIDLRKSKRLKVINLCTNYNYLGKGYYVSLLAEARGMRCVPSVADIVTLNWKRNYQSNLPELQELIDKHYNEPPKEPLKRTYTVYFGRTENAKLDAVARRLFDLFRFPLMGLKLKFGNNGKWEIESVDPMSTNDIPKEKSDTFYDALDHFTGAAWRMVGKKAEKYWIAILHDPAAKMPPSDKAAMRKFAKVGTEMGLFIEFITRQDYATLLEYDALFIRETTAINHHTFRFAHKAEQEGIPCIDDAQSIIRCCNKVFQHELLEAHGVPVPRTIVMDRRMEKTLAEEINYPAVLKIPDGSFSRGVTKVENEREFHSASQTLLKNSEIILCQEFVQSEFDWRIGVLNNEPLYACQYHMAKNHWQIYNHNAKKPGDRVGYMYSFAIDDVPKEVLRVALKAAKLIGNGLYGIDLKQTKNGVVVMEVNDNPSLDGGLEDQILGDDLYRRILGRMVEMIEERPSLSPAALRTQSSAA